MCSTLIIATLDGAIRIAISSIVQYLKDSHQSVRVAAISGLSSLGAHCMCGQLSSFFTCSTVIIAKLHKEIRKAICSIVMHLKDSDPSVRVAATNALSNLAAHRTCYHLSSFDVLNDDHNDDHSSIAWGN